VGDGAGSLGVMRLRDVGGAFGAEAVRKPIALVTNLTADIERPWAEYNRGKPLTQRQLARMLGDFGIISVSVHPPELVHGKGYRRVDPQPPLEGDFPQESGQDTPSDQVGAFQAGERASAGEMVITSDFSSGRKDPPPGSKNGKLARSHAGLPACPDEIGVQEMEGQTDPDLEGNSASHH